MTSAIVRTLRPKQWLKNVLVFAAPGAAGVLDQPRELALSVVTFVAFCCAASGIYVWNDIFDIDADRRHPTKRNRPIASGELPLGAAKVLGVLLPVAALALAATTGRWETVAVIAVYVALTITYSIWWKHIAVVDLVAVASGFVLRAAAGAVAVDVPMSRWFILFITFGSMFVVSGKRYAELQSIGEEAMTRSTLHTYTRSFLQMVLAVACGGALISYCVWAFEIVETTGPDLPWYELTIVPMIVALLRYLLILDRGDGGAPEDVFTSDNIMLIAGATWVVVYGVAVYAA